MKRVSFFVPGHPRPQTRQQFRIVMRKEAKQLVERLRAAVGSILRGTSIDREQIDAAIDAACTAKNYVPVPFGDDTKDEKERIAMHCIRALHEAKADRHSGPCAVLVMQYFKVPTSLSARERLNRFWYIQTPDADNVLKLVKDALNGIAWDDDRQVFDSHPWKTWHPTREGYAITVLQLDPDPHKAPEEFRALAAVEQDFLREAYTALLSGRSEDAATVSSFAQARLDFRCG